MMVGIVDPIYGARSYYLSCHRNVWRMHAMNNIPEDLQQGNYSIMNAPAFCLQCQGREKKNTCNMLEITNVLPRSALTHTTGTDSVRLEP